MQPAARADHHKMKLTLLAAFLVAVARGHAQSNAIANGSFEVYLRPPALWTAPSNGDYGIPPGDTNIAGWSVINGPVAYVRVWPAASGISSIDLSGDGNPVSGGVARSVQTQTGGKYIFSFHISGNPGTSFPRDPSEKRLSVRIGEVQQVYSYDTAVEQNTFGNMKWRQNQILYLASTNLTRIELVNVMGTNLTGPVIDNIILQECVPPTLSIQPVGTNVVVSWPDGVCPVVLEWSSVVGVGALWQTNSLPPAHVGGRSLTTNVISTTQFFRLRLQ